MRQAIDEQAEVVEQRINLLSHEVHESVKDNEVATDRLCQMIQENREAVHRSHAASEDEILKNLDKLEGRMFSVEKTIGMRTPAGEWNLNPAVQPPGRATSSGANANFRELNLKLEKALLEHEKFAKWASESIGGINEEQTILANRMSRLQSGRGSQAIERSAGPVSPQDWHEAIDEVNRKVQDLSRRVQRHHGDHDDVLARFETLKSRVEQYEASSGILNQVLDDIRRQIRSLPANSDQARSAVRREIDSFRSTLEGAMRRISTVESNVRTLNGMNNRIMAQLYEIEGHVDEAACIIQGVQENQVNPPQPRERRNVGYDAFAGQGHRIRSPTPTPGEGNGRGTGLPVRPGGGVDLVDHALPDVPGRVDPSRVPAIAGLELVPTSRVPAIAGGPLELHLIVDRPRHRLQDKLPVPVAQVRQKSVPSMNRRHPDAEFLCVTCNREFCRLCWGDDGDCCNCHFLKMKCWACHKSAQEFPMYSCTECTNHICEDHSHFGNDGLERCARCNIRHERAVAGPPPPPPPGGGGGQGGPSGQGGSGSGGHGHAPFPPPVLDIPAEAEVLDLLEARVQGLLPGVSLVEHPGSMVVLLILIAGNNQCGSSFYGPAYGGGVGHQGVGAGVSQPNDAVGYPPSVASGGNLGPGLSLGYSVNGA